MSAGWTTLNLHRRRVLAASLVLNALGLTSARAASADEPLPPPAEAAPVFVPPATPEVPPAAPVAAPVASSRASGVPARAPETDGEVPEDPHPHVAPRYDMLRVGLGLRMGYVASDGYDLFSDDDVLPQFSIDATYTVFHRARFSVAAGVAFDIGRSESRLRTFASSLSAGRLTVPIEGRFHATPWLYAFARVAPGTAFYGMTVEDSSAAGGRLTQAPWVFASDFSAGASFLLGPGRGMEKRRVRFWLTPEAGYAFTATKAVLLGADRSADEAFGADTRVDGGSLSTSGFFWRATLGLTF